MKSRSNSSNNAQKQFFEAETVLKIKLQLAAGNGV